MSTRWLAGPGRPLTRFGEAPRYREGLHAVADGCYAWMVPNGSWGETNLGLIDCGGESVLVDTCWDLSFTREMLAHSAPVLERSPVGYVINTHADGDHCWGNQLFAGREIIASHACIGQMHHLRPVTLRALTIAGGALGHVPFGGIDKFGRYVRHMFGPYDFEGIRITQPTQGFSGEKLLRVRDVELVLIEVGPGHTDGDILVHVPARRVAYAADLVFVGVTPVLWAGPAENVVAGLRRLLALDADVFVPGHGPFATRADIELLIRYWESAEEELHRRFQRSMTPFEAASDLVQSPEFRRSPFARWDSPERMVTNAFTMYRTWGARLPPLPEKLGTMNMLRQQAELAFALSS